MSGRGRNQVMSNTDHLKVDEIGKMIKLLNDEFVRKKISSLEFGKEVYRVGKEDGSRETAEKIFERIEQWAVEDNVFNIEFNKWKWLKEEFNVKK